MVAALLTRKDKTMNLQNTIRAYINSEIDAWITDHGDIAEVMRAEIAALEELKRACEMKIRANREIAVEEGYAEWNLVTIKEHVRQEHTQKRFKWIA
jgi:hypothetical protein